MLILGLFAPSQMSKIRAAGDDIAINGVPSFQTLNALTVTGVRMRVLSHRLLTDREPNIQNRTIELLAEQNQQLNQSQAAYAKLISSPVEQSDYNDYMRLMGEYRKIETRLVTLSRAGDLQGLTRVLNAESAANAEQINVALGKLTDFNNAQLAIINQSAADQYSSAFNWVVGLLIIASLLTMLFAWLLTKSITQPIALALEAAETIAEGNLTRPIKVDGTDEAGRVAARHAKNAGETARYLDAYFPIRNTTGFRCRGAERSYR